MKDKIKNICIKFNKFLDSKIIRWIMFIIYLSFAFILVLNHECWIDEGQVWEIAKNLSIPEIFAQMKYEGHSCLWHLIIAIPAKLGLPVISMNIISLILVSIPVYMILFKTNWHILVKIAVIFNPTFLYYLSVISRCYSMAPLLLYLFMKYYPDRHKHPIIYTNILGLLAHTHIVMCAFVLVASVIFIFENINSAKGNYKILFKILAIFLIYFVLLAAQILPALNNCSMIKANYTLERFDYIIYQLSRYFIPHVLADKYHFAVVPILIVSFILLFIHNKKLSFVYLFFIGLFIFIHFNWPFVLYERIALIFAVIIFLNFYNKNVINQIFITIMAILSSIAVFYYIPNDLTGALSASKEVGNWMNENVEDGSLVVFLNTERQVSIVPYITKDLDYYYVKHDLFQSYIEWLPDIFLDFSTVYSKLSHFYQEYDNIYIIHSLHPIAMVEDTSAIANTLLENNMITLEFKAYSNELLNECFIVYKLNYI